MQFFTFIISLPVYLHECVKGGGSVAPVLWHQLREGGGEGGGGG